MKRPPTVLAALLALVACDPESPAHESPSFRGEQLECVAPDELYEPYVTAHATLRTPHELEIHDGASMSVDDKNNVVYLDNDDESFSCHCDSGCGGSTCTLEITDTVAVCRGECGDVTSDDGEICWGCEWHKVPMLDPDAGGDGGPKLPADPTAGEVDPTGFDPELPPFDPTAGELDPTW